MSEKWILTVKTSLPKKAANLKDLKNEGYVFESFEDGKAKLFEILRGFALSENSMFDGNGNVKSFIEYCDFDEIEEYIAIAECMKAITLGEPWKPFDNFYDGSILANVDEESLTIFGSSEGWYNGICPKVMTNIGNMTEEKNYYYYVDDMFSSDESSSELYIDYFKSQN